MIARRYVMRRRDSAATLSESCSETGLNCSLSPAAAMPPAMGAAAGAAGGSPGGGGGGCNADEDLLQVRETCFKNHLAAQIV